MGGGRDMDDHDRYYQGVALCLEAGALEDCEIHEGTYFQGQTEIKDVYKLVNAKVSRGELGEPSSERRKYLCDAVKDAYDDNSAATACYQCEKAFGAD